MGFLPFKKYIEKHVIGTANFRQRNRGPLLMLASQAIAALAHGIVKFLETEAGKIDPLQILIVRMLVTVAACSFYQWRTGSEEFPLGPPRLRSLLVTRAIAGIFGATGFYYSLQVLPLAEATVINFLAPLIACWVSALLIHGSFGRVERLATLCSFVGIVLITKPDFIQSWWRSTTSMTTDSNKAIGGGILASISRTASTPPESQQGTTGYSIGILFALLGAFGGACGITVIGIVGKRAHPITTVNYFGVSMIIFSAISFVVVPGVNFDFHISWTSWVLLIVVGVCGFVMELLGTAGLSAEASSRATYMIYSQVVFALLTDEIFWGKIPDLSSLLGGSMVLVGVVMVVTVGNHNRRRPSKSSKSSSYATECTEAADIYMHRTTDIRTR